MINFIVFWISSVIKEAEANRLKLTPEFLQLKFIESVTNNTKIFFGEKVFSSPLSYFKMFFSVRVDRLNLLGLLSRFQVWSWIRGCLATSFKKLPEGQLQRQKQISKFLESELRWLASIINICERIPNLLSSTVHHEK